MTTHLLDGLLTTAVSLVLFVLWADNLSRSLALWQAYRDARSFRAFLIAVLLACAAVTYFLGSVALYLIPGWLEAVRFLGLMVRGAFLVVGIVAFVSWRR